MHEFFHTKTGSDYLEILESAAGAIRLYEKHGFVRGITTLHYYKDGKSSIEYLITL